MDNQLIILIKNDLSELEKVVQRFDVFSKQNGLPIKIKHAAAGYFDASAVFGLGIKIVTGYGFGLDLDCRAGGTYQLDAAGGMKFKSVGLSALKEAVTKLEKKTADLKIVDMAIRTNNLDFGLYQLKLMI